MGSSPSGILAYGYDLGGPESGWKLANVDKYGGCDFSWYDPESEDVSFDEAVDNHLLAELVGFTDKYEDYAEGGKFFERQREARAKVRVELAMYGSYDYPNYILCVKPYLYVGDWGAKPIPQFDFSYHSSNQELDKALKVLGITPTQQDPQWILACMYG